MSKYKVTMTIPYLDDGEGESFTVELDEITSESVNAVIDAHDAELCGVPIEDCAGFTMVMLVAGNNENAFIARTNGLGPHDRDNALCVGTLQLQ